MKSTRSLQLLVWLAALCLYGCPSVDWSENYDPEGKQPFDLYALKELLADRSEGLTTLRSSSSLEQLDTLESVNYLFVGDYPYYTQEATDRLMAFVERGNNAFIAANDLPEHFLFELFREECDYEEDSTEFYLWEDYLPDVYLDTVKMFRYPAGDSFELINTWFWEVSEVALSTIPEMYLCEGNDSIRVLGGIDTAGINFVRIDRGEGSIYLHSNPRFFTNWFILDSVQYRYPENVMQAIAGGPVVWDETSRRYRRSVAGAGSHANRDYEGGRNLLNGNETLRYIQNHPALAFSWYALLAGVLLYVIFRGKRRQRIIPLIPPRENSSRRFIDTISRLVHQKGNHAALAQRELASLRFHLNNRFGIRWADGDPPPTDLPGRLGLPAAVTERAMAQIRLVSAGRPLQEGDLLRFYRAIEPLYHV